MITDSFHLSLLERAIAASSNGIIIADAAEPDRPIIYCNPAFEKLTGYIRDEVIGLNCRFLQGSDTDPAELERLRSSLRSGTEIQVILKNYRKDKTPFWNELTVSPVRDANGNLTHFIGVQNDITKKVAAETALQESEERWRAIATATPVPMLITSLEDSVILYANSALGQTFGLNSKKILGCKKIDFYANVGDCHQLIESVKQNGFSDSEQICLKKANGSLFWVKMSMRLTHFNGQEAILSAFYDITDRVEAEAALRASEAKFQKLAANVPGMIYQFLLRPDGSNNFIYVSQGCRELYELELEEILNNSDLMWSAVHPEDRKSLEKSIAISAQTLKPWKYEGRMITKSGKLKWIRGIARPEKQPGGDILWDGLTIDISDRKQAEIALGESKIALQKANQELEQRVKERTYALKASQQMLWLVINNIPQYIVWKDRNSVFLGCNQNFANKAGFHHPAELIGLSDLDMPWKAEETEFFRACDRRIIKNNSPEYHIVEPQMQADGTQRWLDANKIPLHDNYGNAVGILCCFEDITDRLALEEKVRTSEELFRKIFEDAPIGIDLANLENHQLVQVNKAYCEMLGYTESELLRKTFIDIVHSEDVPENIQADLALDRGEITSYQLEKRLISATGKIVWANVTATLIRDGEGKPIYNLGMIENITDRKISEAALQASEAQLRKQTDQLQQAYEQLQHTQIQLVHSEKMSSLGQMVAGIAHEINNPATFINGNISHTYNYFDDLIELLNLYQHCYPEPETQISEKIQEIDLEFLKEDLPKMLNSMKIGVERISKIVLSLRNFARLDEAEMKFADIHEGIDSTLLILQHRLNQNSQENRIEIVKKYGQLPKVYCCAGQLNQVFLNILANAIDALEKQQQPRTIVIRTELKKAALNAKSESEFSQCDRVVICIADSGPGMTEDIHKRLFDPFFTTKPVGSGTGLGLSISYQIVVEKHRGTLRCICAPDRGAEFWIEIPV
jgi:PAS domain S-box-containing protein